MSIKFADRTTYIVERLITFFACWADIHNRPAKLTTQNERVLQTYIYPARAWEDNEDSSVRINGDPYYAPRKGNAACKINQN